jgi:mono/diheme cytochrome c family protein
MKLLAVLASALTILVSALHAQQDMGKATFAICMACHGPDGKGLPAAGDKKTAPPLSGSKLANGNPAIFALIVLKGIKKENDTYIQTMAPLPLPPPLLAAVMTYVRSNFANKSPAMTEEQVKGYIEKWKAVAGPISRAKLDELTKELAK